MSGNKGNKNNKTEKNTASSNPPAVDFKKENITLKNELKDLQAKISSLESELEKANEGQAKLEKLHSELVNQSQELKDESVTKIKDAEERGLDLANEVSASMEFMTSMSSNVEKLSDESKTIKKDNEELSEKMEKMKEHYDRKEKVLRTLLQEKVDEVVKVKTEIAEVRLQNALDKERLFGEMQQLATTLVQSREQMKEAKETELELRIQLQNYDQKFNDLQKSLKETNNAYNEFRGDMEKVSEKTKNLEEETVDWKSKWDGSNAALKAAEENHTKIQNELTKAHEGLVQMTNLCRALQAERQEFLKALNRPK